MPYVPRLRDEILQEMVACVVAKSVLTDVGEGSVLLSILGAVAEEMEHIEFRLSKIRDAFSLEGAAGSDLDERVGELPPPGVQRLEASAASGASMKVTRDTAVAELVVPAGTVYAREDDANAVYVQTENVTMAIGELEYPPNPATPAISVVSANRGVTANADIGAVTRLISGPDDIIAVTNINPVTGGQDRETDEQLVQRALLYLSSLARCQPRALEYAARAFSGSQGIRIRHAFAYEDPERPGYTELVVDDGSGMQGYEAAGQEVTGTVPLQGQSVIWHQGPAIEPIDTIEVDAGGGFVTVSVGSPPKWVSVEERGAIYVLDQSFMPPGSDWKVSGYDVYTGVIRELQAEIEGDPSDLAETPGWRAAGTRVRVVPPLPEIVPFVVNVVVNEGTDLAKLRVDLADEIVSWMADLPPGEPLLINRLVSRLIQSFDELRTLSFQQPTGDVYPSTSRHVLRANAAQVEVV